VDNLTDLQQIIAATLEVPTSSVLPGSRASDFSAWDSVHHLLLILEIEQKFGFKFALEEIPDLDTVDKIMRAVQKRVAT
jgi:acyl carrier protein